MYFENDPPAIQVAAHLAIERRSVPLLQATLAVGLDPHLPFHVGLWGPWYASPVEQAIAAGWDEGTLLMIRLQ